MPKTRLRGLRGTMSATDAMGLDVLGYGVSVELSNRFLNGRRGGVLSFFLTHPMVDLSGRIYDYISEYCTGVDN